jgi:hypothetical protein
MRTSSLWGKPPTRYYKFLARVEATFPSKFLRVAILGCSDGKFVLPAARRGHSVLAIDIDEIALYGGTKLGPTGAVQMLGLSERLRREHLSQRVSIVHEDFVEYRSAKRFHAVFTSGAVQYSRNMKHSLEEIVRKLKTYVGEHGYIYVDYMLATEEKHRRRDNYPTKEIWSNFFEAEGWQVIYNRVLPPLFEAAHVDNPVDHYHHWGHLLAQKTAK